MAIIGTLASWLKQGRENWKGPSLVDTVGDPGTDEQIPTEKAVRDAINAAGSGSSESFPPWRVWFGI